jgi:rare lipoprotein A
MRIEDDPVTLLA